MPDIRLVRSRGSRVWLWSLVFAAIGLVALGTTLFFGDATEEAAENVVGADAGFAGERAAVLPLRTQLFEEVEPLEPRQLGRLLRLRGTAESPVRGGAAWVRAVGGRRILVRFEPVPEDSAVLRRIGPGSGVDVRGYLQKISQAELKVWLDTLGVKLPRPRPGTKFGDLPDPAFAAVDSLFVKTFYVSVRPEGIGPPEDDGDAAPVVASGEGAPR